MKRIEGRFSIKSAPLPIDDTTAFLGAGRLRFDKTFEGPLSGTSVVAMSGLMNQALGSGGYVALERFEAELEGKRGVFFLQHSSTMSRGVGEQSILVIPDSGTEELAGIQGSMQITIRDGQHFYVFDYELSSDTN